MTTSPADPARPPHPADPHRPGDGAEAARAFRAFVRRHHPDVGGDPEVFRRGVEAFRTGVRAPGTSSPDAAAAPGAPGSRPWSGTWTSPLAADDPRLDAPIVAVSGRDRHRHRLGRAGRRLWPFARVPPRVV